MQIGVPKEVKSEEHRIALTPGGAADLVARGHQVLVQKDAGVGAGFTNEEYQARGAKILDNPKALFEQAELIVKVKEPVAEERCMLRENQVLFTFLHLAADLAQTRDLMAQKVTAIAYESVVGPKGGLPLLAPMSQVAGRMSIQAGAHCLESAQGGRGVLLGGVPGVAPAKVVILGGGVVGKNAVQMAIGLGADVTVIDQDVSVLDTLSSQYRSALRTLHPSGGKLEEAVINADLVVGAVLVRGARAPHLINADLVQAMQPNSTVVDVAIDQGGCVQTSRATTHRNPTFVEYEVIHYCVANMPGAVPRTSTLALENATLPYVTELAEMGAIEAMQVDSGLRSGLSVYRGQVTDVAVADSLGLPFTSPEEVLGLDKAA